MKKMLSLIKACMTEDMSLFKIKTKKQDKLSKIMFPLFLTITCFFAIWSYANMLMEPLKEYHVEYVLLTLFVFFTTIITFVEGIYKSGNLLFNCKDDNLLLSLPIKKSTVLFIRVLKFYIFELLYNSIFLVPAIVVYATNVSVNIQFYIVSIIAILLLPIIPIIISCIIGGIISAISTKFKFKNIAQTVLTMGLLVGILYLSANLQSIVMEIAKNASSVNEMITKLYYPAGLYINLITNFNIKELIIFVLINIVPFIITITVLSNFYFKINSDVKIVKSNSKNKDYKIKTSSPFKALVKKEINRFVNSPVFVINAGFGLVLFVIGCIGISVKFDSFINMVAGQEVPISNEQILAYIPAILFGLICFGSLMSSISSSMISLEGKSFTILKSLPIKPFIIVLAKIFTAVIIMIPFMIVGDIIMFVKFQFSIMEMIILLLSSIVLPFVAETIGIIVNLKYPKMNAENDTEVVKQSMSSAISVFIGMLSVGLTVGGIYKLLEQNISVDTVISIGLGFYTILLICLLIYLNKKSMKEFKKIGE